MSLTKRLGGYRFVDIEQGDTLQRIAERELGNAARWTELIAINDLVPPFLTGDVSQASPRVLAYGQQLLVPATTVQTSAASDPDRVFGVDLLLSKGRLGTMDGDLALVAGRDNLRQALLHRILTPLRELVFHRNYGCGVHSLKGKSNSPTALILGGEYVRGSVANDRRIASVGKATVRISGDLHEVHVSATPVAGTSIDITSAV